LFDYYLRINDENLQFEWVKWVDLIEADASLSAKDVKVHEIIVKTNDTVRYSKLLEFALKNNYAIIVCGPTGTGKTTLVKNFYH
jgi:type IV secretory pathway ATPase VirB11/archaellum biosynthesis ATPase